MPNCAVSNVIIYTINYLVTSLLQPPMSASRVKLIGRVFEKLDKTGDGIITVEDLKGVYFARKHPKFENGELSETQVFQLFLKSFEAPNQVDGKVTFCSRY